MSTDKLFTTITSSEEGKVHKLLIKEQQVCQVGQPYIELQVHEKSDATKILEKSVDINKESKIQKSKKPLSSPVIFPAALHYAKLKKVDFTQIKGTGFRERIEKSDIDRYILSRQQPKSQQKIELQSFTKVDVSQRSKASESTMGIPTFYFSDEISFEQTKHMFKTQQEQLALLMKTMSLSLLKFPILNAQYHASRPYQYTLFNSHNVRFVYGNQQIYIYKLQQMTITDILQSIKSPSISAEQSLPTLSLYASPQLPGTYSAPKVRSPQILAIGIGKKKERVYISIGADHRVLDGATVARFFKEWKQKAESPRQLLMALK